MTDPNQKPSAKDDPLVITAVVFAKPVGSIGAESWSLTEAAHSMYHGKVRCETCQEGVRLFYRAGTTYQEITVYASHIASVTRVPMSSLPVPAKAVLERMRAEVVRP
jgi:hypothetical protein